VYTLPAGQSLDFGAEDPSLFLWRPRSKGRANRDQLGASIFRRGRLTAANARLRARSLGNVYDFFQTIRRSGAAKDGNDPGCYSTEM